MDQPGAGTESGSDYELDVSTTLLSSYYINEDTAQAFHSHGRNSFSLQCA